MSTADLLSLMRLLSALESAALTAKIMLPPHLSDDVRRHVEILENAILESTAK